MPSLCQSFLKHYAAATEAEVAPFILGERVLDVGAGEGYLAARLHERRGVWSCAVDVGPYRRVRGPYVVYDGRRLPFPDESFDTTLILLTLHHCQDAEAVLSEAFRVTRRRLIVTESVYRNRVERFWLHLLDGRVNRYRHDGAMRMALGFRRPREWRELFVARGLRPVEARWLGRWWERLVHHPLLFVLDKCASPGGGRCESGVGP